MTDNGHENRKRGIQYIDSRHLYLNHMDPLEAVVTIFNRQIGDQLMGIVFCSVQPYVPGMIGQ